MSSRVILRTDVVALDISYTSVRSLEVVYKTSPSYRISIPDRIIVKLWDPMNLKSILLIKQASNLKLVIERHDIDENVRVISINEDSIECKVLPWEV